MVDIDHMLGKRRWLSIGLVVALATIGLGASVEADSGSEQGFLAKINSERAAAGLGSVSMDSGLQSWARTHTAHMIEGQCAPQTICHSSSADLQAAAGSGWSALGENVGRGGSVGSLHDAFMDSPGHCSNVLGGYNKVGIGTDTSNGILYVTVVFMNKGGSSAHAKDLCPGGAGSGGSNPTTTSTTTAAPETTTPTSQPNPTAPPDSQETTTTTTAPASTTTTTLIVGPDKPVTPGHSCFSATKFWWMCHD